MNTWGRSLKGAARSLRRAQVNTWGRSLKGAARSLKGAARSQEGSGEHLGAFP